MRHGELPREVLFERTTDELTAESTPRGLLRAHRLAPGIWGLLRVSEGSMTFVWEGDDARRLVLLAGDSLVIAPEVRHHIEPAADVRFVVEFYRS
jgi:tellurite resistance-related uncharacterized protein